MKLCKQRNSPLRTIALVSHGTGCTKGSQVMVSIERSLLFLNVQDSIVNVTCSPSPFQRLPYSFWPRRTSPRINSRPRLAHPILSSEWISLYSQHRGADLNQMRKQFSVASSHRWPMLWTITSQRQRNLRESGTKKNHRKYQLTYTQKHGKILLRQWLIRKWLFLFIVWGINFWTKRQTHAFMLLLVMMLKTLAVKLAVKNYPMYTCIVMDAKSSWIKTIIYALPATQKGSVMSFTKWILSLTNRIACSITQETWRGNKKTNAADKHALFAPTALGALARAINALLSTFVSWVWKMKWSYSKMQKA